MKKLLILSGILFATLSSVSAKEIWTGIKVYSNDESQKFYSETFDSLSFEKIYAEPLPENPPVATKTPNTTIDEIKALITEYSGEELFSATLLGDKDDKGTHYIIHGRVISSDKDENIVKLLVIQDETGAISIPVNMHNLWLYYPVGQELVVDITGLYIGMYEGQYQIGALAYYHGSPDIGYLPFEVLSDHSEKNGYPSTEIEYVDFNHGNMVFPADKPYCIRITMTDIHSLSRPQDRVKLIGQLIEISGIQFVNGGTAPFSYFLKTTYNIIVDSLGFSLRIRDSGKTPYYNEILPEGKGSIRGILFSYYMDSFQFYSRSSEDIMFPTFNFKSRNKEYWSGLTLSKNGKYVNVISSDILDRVDFFEEEISARIGTGEWDDPYSVPQILKGVENERNKWVTGFIVGYVDIYNENFFRIAEHTAIFNAEGAPTTNLLLADSPEETNWQNCIPVQLFGIDARSISLYYHPEYLGRQVTLRGEVGSPYLGTFGMRSCDIYKWGNEGFYTPTLDDSTTILLTKGLGDCTIEDAFPVPPELNSVWSWNPQFNFANASGYHNGFNYTTDSYLITPKIKMSDKPSATFDQALNYLVGGNISDYVGLYIREGADREWTVLSYDNEPMGNSFSFVTSTIDLSEYAGKTVQIGFRYKSDEQYAPTWEIKNLYIK